MSHTTETMRHRVVSEFVHRHTVALDNDDTRYLIGLLERDLFPSPPKAEPMMRPAKRVAAVIQPVPTQEEMLQQFPLDSDNDVDFGMSPLVSTPLSSESRPGCYVTNVPATEMDALFSSPFSPALPDADEPALPGEETPQEEVASTPLPVVDLEVLAPLESEGEPFTEDDLKLLEIEDVPALCRQWPADTTYLAEALSPVLEDQPADSVGLSPEPAEKSAENTQIAPTVTAIDTRSEEFERALTLGREMREELLYQKGGFEPFCSRVIAELGLDALSGRRLANKVYKQVEREENTAMAMMAVRDTPVRRNGSKPEPTPEPTDPAARQCSVCGKVLERRENEFPSTFERRMTCSKECASLAMSRAVKSRHANKRDRNGIRVLD